MPDVRDIRRWAAFARSLYQRPAVAVAA